MNAYHSKLHPSSRIFFKRKHVEGKLWQLPGGPFSGEILTWNRAPFLTWTTDFLGSNGSNVKLSNADVLKSCIYMDQNGTWWLFRDRSVLFGHPNGGLVVRESGLQNGPNVEVKDL